MRTTLRSPLVSAPLVSVPLVLVLLVLALVPGSVVLAQEDVAEPDLESVLNTLDAVIKAKDTRNAPASIEAILNLFLEDKIDEKEYKKVCDRLKKVYALGKNAVQVKAVLVMGNFGKAAAKDLVRFVNDRGLKAEEKQEVYFAVIQGLGLTKQPAAMKVLLKLLKDRRTPVIVAAAEALVHFSEARGPYRKEISKEMIKLLASAFSGAQDPRKTAQVQKYAALAGPFNNTLQSLTSASPGNPTAWQRWLNDNKKRRW